PARWAPRDRAVSDCGPREEATNRSATRSGLVRSPYVPAAWSAGAWRNPSARVAYGQTVRMSFTPAPGIGVGPGDVSAAAVVRAGGEVNDGSTDGAATSAATTA